MKLIIVKVTWQLKPAMWEKLGRVDSLLEFPSCPNYILFHRKYKHRFEQTLFHDAPKTKYLLIYMQYKKYEFIELFSFKTDYANNPML